MGERKLRCFLSSVPPVVSIGTHSGNSQGTQAVNAAHIPSPAVPCKQPTLLPRTVSPAIASRLKWVSLIQNEIGTGSHDM